VARGLRRVGVPIVCAALTAAGLASGASAAPWGFEQVTPTVKGGGTLNSFDTFRASEDGSRILYTTTAPLDGVLTYSAPQYVRYQATRTESEWLNRALDPLFDLGSHSSSLVVMTVLGSSPDLEYALVTSTRALTPGAIEGGSNVYMREAETGQLTLVVADSSNQLVGTLTNAMGAVNVKFVASDGRSAMFVSEIPLTADAAGVNGALYSWTAETGLRAESVLPDSEGGTTMPAIYAGRDSESGPRDPLPREDALDHVYFTPQIFGSVGSLYVRTSDGSGGRETRPVSVSEVSGLPVPAQLDAVSADGRYALFHTRDFSPLTATVPAGHEGANAYLYRYDLESDTTDYVGPLSQQQGADVLQMTEDGQTVAFQTGMAIDSDAVVGEVNTYVWRNGNLQHVATADPGSAATDAATFLRLLSPNGRYLAFTDNSASLAATFDFDNQSAGCPPLGSPEGTVGPCTQVYRFDSEAPSGSDALECLSCRSDGASPAGASGEPNYDGPGLMRMDARQMRTVTDDGTVFFTSADDLITADSNGASDAYVYRDGSLELLSRAVPGTRSRFVDATRDGTTVFIATNDPIVATDTDKEVDLYMTRAGAGFDIEPPVSLVPCTGADCRGPFDRGPLPGGENLGSRAGNGEKPSSPTTPRATVRVRSARLVGSRLRVKISTSQAGRVRVSGSALSAATRTLRRAGTATITVPLKKSSRTALRRNGRLAVRARVSVAPPFGKTAVTTYRRTLRK